jgi:alginate production protein
MFHGERMGVVKGGRVGRVVARPIVATMLGLTLDVAVADGQRPEPPLVVRNVRVESVGGGRRVIITLNRTPDGVRGARLDDPLRIEIDIDGPPAEAAEETRFPVTDDVVAGVRARVREGGLSVVLDLRRDPGPSDVRAEGAEVIADLGEAYVTRPSLGVGLEGKRLKLTGRWVEDRLEVSRVEHRSSRKDPRNGRVDGPIRTVGPEPRTFLVGPLVVEWSEATQFVGLTPEELAPGMPVEAAGRLSAPARLVANTIEKAKPGRGEILGAVTAEERRPGGSIALTVLGVEAVVPVGVPTRGSDLARRLDEKRPDKQETFSVRGRPLIVGGELQVETEYQKNFDLDNSTAADEVELDDHIELEGLYYFTPRVLTFVQGKFTYAPSIRIDTGERDDEKEIERRQHWLFVGDILQNRLGPGYSVQVGRQKFQEVREWWWDEDLDAFRVYYDRPQMHGELGVAQELAPESTLNRFTTPDQEDVFRFLGTAAWGWAERQRLDFFYLYHLDYSGQRSIGEIVTPDSEDPSDARLLWLGTRASGELDWGTLGDLLYGVDGAWVGGDETVYTFDDCADADTKPPCPTNKHDPTHERLSARSHHDVRGFAIDSRVTLESPLPRQPAITLGYAFGSGDPNARHGQDTGFRQTGLHANNDRFLGVDRFRYYGELVEPELSNLHIVTASLGYRISVRARSSSSTTTTTRRFPPRSCATRSSRPIRTARAVRSGTSGTWCSGWRSGSTSRSSSSARSSVQSPPSASSRATSPRGCS